MNRFVLSLAALGLTTAAAYAQATPAEPVTDPSNSFEFVDSDKNGEVSLTEFQAAFPDKTETDFEAADVDKNGWLSAEEFDNAVTASTGEGDGVTEGGNNNGEATPPANP